MTTALVLATAACGSSYDPGYRLPVGSELVRFEPADETVILEARDRAAAARNAPALVPVSEPAEPSSASDANEKPPASTESPKDSETPETPEEEPAAGGDSEPQNEGE